MNLLGHTELQVRQRAEWGEVLLDVEGRNKYEIRSAEGAPVGFAVEQGKGLLGLLFRQLLGHWRRFELVLFDARREERYRARHPFRFFFQRLEVYDTRGRLVGALQQRFSLLRRRFDVEDAQGRVVMEMVGPWLKPWTFPFTRDGVEVGRVEKKWSGLVKEAFTDADNFRVAWDARASEDERALLLAASLFIDLQYFEEAPKKQTHPHHKHEEER
jgi:uncharacterized protein YxjI